MALNPRSSPRRIREWGTEAYSNAEFDAEFLRTQRSGWVALGSRLVMLIFVFAVMARAIAAHDLSAGFLLLPFAVEFLAVMWVGLYLSYFVVDCPAFAKTSRKPKLAWFWTILILGIISSVLAWDSGHWDSTRIVPGWVNGWAKVLETGLIWALLAELAGLVFATVPEVRRWRAVGGKFIWACVMDLALRTVAMLLIGIVLFFLLAMFADAGGAWLFETSNRRAWLVYGFLMSVETAALLFGFKIYRDLKRKAGKSE